MSHLLLITFIFLIGGFAQSTFAQGKTVIPPPLRPAEFDPGDSTRAFDPKTGQNLYWDCVKKTWVDAKTGKAAGYEGRHTDDGEVIPPPLRPAEFDPVDPTRAFDPKTGQNLHWDRDKKTWVDSKTGKASGYEGRHTEKPCPPPATGTTPQPKPTPTPEKKKDACDIEFGYDYMRAPGERVKSLHGFSGSLFCNVKPWIGIGGDFSALYGSTTDTVGTTKFDVSLHRQTYLFGPQFNFNANDEVKVFVHPLFGGVHDTSRTTIGTTSVSSSASAFAMEFGGGVDVRLNDHIAVRPIAFDYIPTHFGGAWQSNYRFSTGIVFRLGGH